jgi:hypothetical protein
MWDVTKRDREHLVRRRHFEVEWTRQFGLEPRDIAIRDVPTIFTKVRGDAVGPRLDGEMRRPERIGMPPATRIPDRGNVIDIDPEPLIRGATERPVASLQERGA